MSATACSPVTPSTSRQQYENNMGGATPSSAQTAVKPYLSLSVDVIRLKDSPLNKNLFQNSIELGTDQLNALRSDGYAEIQFAPNEGPADKGTRVHLQLLAGDIEQNSLDQFLPELVEQPDGKTWRFTTDSNKTPADVSKLVFGRLSSLQLSVDSGAQISSASLSDKNEGPDGNQ